MSHLDTAEKYDYILIGAGGSGAVFARRFTDLYMNSLLVLEMGKNHAGDERVANAANLFVADSSSDITEEYLTQRDPNISNLRTDVSQGRGWGGSTAHYYMYAIRPSQGYLSAIEPIMGISPLTWNSHFQSLERYIPRPGGAINSSRGTDGPMIVTQLPIGGTNFNMTRVDSTGVVNDLVPDGLGSYIASTFGVTALTFPNDDYNAVSSPASFITNRYQVFAADAGSKYIRQDAGSKFLIDSVVTPEGVGVGDHCNLRIIDNTKVTQIHFKPVKNRHHDKPYHCNQKVRPYAVDAWVDNKCCSFYARCGVILAAGAIETPALLQRSGIGPCSILDPLCIERKVINEHVGRHGLTHGSFQATYWIEETPFETSNPDIGAIESLVSLNGMFPDPVLSTNLPSNIYPPGYTPERSFQLLGSGVGPGPNNKWVSSFYYFNMLPRTEGRVEIVSKDAFTRPNIYLPIFATNEERQSAINTFRGIATSVQDFVDSYNASYDPDLLVTWPSGNPNTLTDAELYSVISHSSIKAHLSGTARMGTLGNSVVGRDFQVHNTCGLYVIDLSVLPLIPDANTAYMAMALGLEFANRLSGKCIRRKCKISSCRVILCGDCESSPCRCYMKKCRVVNCKYCAKGSREHKEKCKTGCCKH